MIRASIARTSPYAGPTGGGLFNGNYDWHSAVHAHWALLAITRVHGDGSLDPQLRERLTPEALGRERAYLNANPQFELPYGQAWLLLTLRELRRYPEVADSSQFRGLQRETRTRVFDWLERSAFPEPGGLTGAHYSWLFSYLLTQLSTDEDHEFYQAKLRELGQVGRDGKTACASCNFNNFLNRCEISPVAGGFERTLLVIFYLHSN